MGGGSTKTIFAQGKLNEKNSCTPINPEKYSCYGLKKNSYKEFYKEKKFLRFENSARPPLPHIRERSVTKTLTVSALDSTQQNHIDREGLRLTFGHLVTNVGRFANESFRQRSFRKRLRSVRKYLWSVRKRVEVSSQTLSTFICVEASSVLISDVNI